MITETLREIFLWSTIVNYGVLLLWFFVFSFAHDWVYRLHGRWFKLTPEHFDAIHYGGMAAYKIGVLLFCLVPYIVLHIVA